MAEELESFVQYEAASRNQRFVNWLIDYLFMRFALSQGTSILIMYMADELFPYAMSDIDYVWYTLLLSYLLLMMNSLLYYTLCEKAFKGYTLGKLVSGTRAIRTDGRELTFRDALLRSVCRLVPFELFSGFGDPWHDTWTRTWVIKAR